MRTRRLGALLLAGVLSTGLAACGDDSGDDAGDALEDVGDSDADVDADADVDVDVDDLDIPNLSGECEFMVEAATAFGAAFSGTGDVDFADVADGLAEIADDAPDEIGDDFAVLAEAYAEFAEAAGDVDFSDPNAFADPEVQAAFAEAGEVFSTPEFEEASANVSAFVDENCGEAAG